MKHKSKNKINISIVNGKMSEELWNSSTMIRKEEFCNVHCTSKAIEQQIKEYNWQYFYDQFKKYRDEKFERQKIPPMIIPFYSYISKHGRLPDIQTFIWDYYELHKDLIKLDENYATLNNAYRYGRKTFTFILLRTYPSLVRDYHFYCKLVESGEFDEVRYSTDDDFNGRDIIVVKDNKEYELSLFVDTTRSNREKLDKNINRHNYGNNEIQLPFRLSYAYTVGDFKLYDDSYVRKVIDEIKELSTI